MDCTPTPCPDHLGVRFIMALIKAHNVAQIVCGCVQKVWRGSLVRKALNMKNRCLTAAQSLWRVPTAAVS